MQQFFNAMNKKFLLRATGECHTCIGDGRKLVGLTFDDAPVYDQHHDCPECNGTGKENRSLRPWVDYDWRFLLDRLQDEMKEYDDQLQTGMIENAVTDAAAGELIDISLMAAFLWLKHNGVGAYDCEKNPRCDESKGHKGACREQRDVGGYKILREES